METSQGVLTEDETHWILRDALRPEHHEDPNVLKFIASYLRCRNSAQAAREAGLDGRSGSNLRNRKDIHEAITRLTEKSVMKHGYDASEVIERVKEISALDPIDLMNEDGSYKESMYDIPPEARRAIKSLTVKNEYGEDPNGLRVVTGKIMKFEFWDKMKGIELLGREKDLFTEKKKIEHDMSSNMSSLLLESKKLAETEAAKYAIDVSPVPQLTGNTGEE